MTIIRLLVFLAAILTGGSCINIPNGYSAVYPSSYHILDACHSTGHHHARH